MAQFGQTGVRPTGAVSQPRQRTDTINRFQAVAEGIEKLYEKVREKQKEDNRLALEREKLDFAVAQNKRNATQDARSAIAENLKMIAEFGAKIVPGPGGDLIVVDAQGDRLKLLEAQETQRFQLEKKKSEQIAESLRPLSQDPIIQERKRYADLTKQKEKAQKIAGGLGPLGTAAAAALPSGGVSIEEEQIQRFTPAELEAMANAPDEARRELIEKQAQKRIEAAQKTSESRTKAAETRDLERQKIEGRESLEIKKQAGRDAASAKKAEDALNLLNKKLESGKELTQRDILNAAVRLSGQTNLAEIFGTGGEALDKFNKTYQSLLLLYGISGASLTPVPVNNPEGNPDPGDVANPMSAAEIAKKLKEEREKRNKPKEK
jgi:hypothetical protein